METNLGTNLEGRDKLQLILQRSREDLLTFMMAVDPSFETHWHLEIIAKELERIEQEKDKNYKVLMIVLPPRHGKSTLATVGFPAWYLGRNPEKEVITISYSGDFAIDFGTKTRDIVDGEAFSAIFGFGLKFDEQGKQKWKVSKGGSYTSVGVGGPITGRGADILVIDDPVKNREEAESELYRQKVWDFFISTAFTRLEPNGVVVVIQTRWHVDDLAGRILANEHLKGRTKVIHFSAIAEHDEEFRKSGEPLWEKRYPLPALEEIRETLGPYEWTALFQGSPTLTESQEFKREWFKYIEESELEKKRTRNVLTIDTAMSKKASADYTGFCDNSIDEENYWNIKAWHQRLNPDELIEMLFALHAQRRYASIGIEKTTFTEGLKPYLQQEQRKRGKFLPIAELEHKQRAKDVRIRGLVPRYASGSIKHVRGQCAVLETELLQFPLGIHDDVVDSLAYQQQVAPKKSQYPSIPMHQRQRTQVAL